MIHTSWYISSCLCAHSFSQSSHANCSSITLIVNTWHIVRLYWTLVTGSLSLLLLLSSSKSLWLKIFIYSCVKGLYIQAVTQMLSLLFVFFRPAFRIILNEIVDKEQEIWLNMAYKTFIEFPIYLYGEDEVNLSFLYHGSYSPIHPST